MEPVDSAALRAFAVLECVARAADPPTLGELTRTLALPKPTVFRILRMLVGAGLVEREMHRKRYVAGPRAAALALDVQMQSPRRGEHRAILARLVETIGETCNLTMLDANEVVYLERVETTANVRLHMKVGSRVPLHCTASGKLLLAMLPKPSRSRLIAHLALNRYTETTITDTRRLNEELARIRAQKYAVDNEELHAGLVCVAVPVTDARKRVCAAIAVHAPASRMPLERALSHLPSLRRAAVALADTL
jgi:DNA-binding IclR family transcriptional regulator